MKFKIPNEIRVALLGIAALVALIFGYNYLKGRGSSLLKGSYDIYLDGIISGFYFNSYDIYGKGKFTSDVRVNDSYNTNLYGRIKKTNNRDCL